MKQKQNTQSTRPVSSQASSSRNPISGAPQTGKRHLSGFLLLLGVLGLGILVGWLAFGPSKAPETPAPAPAKVAQNATANPSQNPPAPQKPKDPSPPSEFRGQSMGSSEIPAPTSPFGDRKPKVIEDNRGSFRAADAPWPCRVNDMCPENSLCNVTSGRCVYMGTGQAEAPVIYTVFPESVAPGDIVLVDGDGLYFEAHDSSRIWKDGRWQLVEEVVVLSSVHVGDKLVPGEYIGEPDECRVVMKVPPGFSGPVSVNISPPDGQVYVAKSKESITLDRKPGDVLDCSKSRVPMASGEIPEDPHILGPYAAGYLDTRVKDIDMRLHYPARCGGLRAPIVEGKFPLVAILHGRGSIYLNYEFLARHLASWGFLVAIPDSSDVPALHAALVRVLTQFNQTFPSVSNHLQGDKILLVGHSRGGMRATMLQDGPLAPHVIGIAMLAPFNMSILSRHPLLLISASEDLQAPPMTIKTYMDRHTKNVWHYGIMGGNHSRFTDRRHWDRMAGLDGEPTLPRNLQHDLIRGIVLTFAQKIHGQIENFPKILRGEDLPSFLYYEKR